MTGLALAVLAGGALAAVLAVLAGTFATDLAVDAEAVLALAAPELADLDTVPGLATALVLTSAFAPDLALATTEFAGGATLAFPV